MRVQKNAARRPIVGAKSRGATLLTGKRPSQCADTVILCADLNAITRSAISRGLLRGVIQKCACAGSQSMACFPVPPAATYSSLRRICRLFAVNDNTPGGKLQVWSAIFNPDVSRIRSCNSRQTHALSLITCYFKPSRILSAIMTGIVMRRHIVLNIFKSTS